jgi:Bifunctional DNA primase/polymerase, N-terminal/Primase C terminal 1 (PriCT-1)
MVASRNRLLRSAVALAARNMCVFPCAPRAKIPATTHGVLDATVDRQVIERWWHDNPDYNVAVATGMPSGLFILDVDGIDAEVELRRFEAKHAGLPSTVEVITARGRHLWFKMPDTELRNSVGKLAPGLDIRAAGGYALAPPSIHPCGRRYAWSVDCANAIAEAPAWLLARIAPSDGGSGSGTTPPSEWRELVTNGVTEGARNDSIARLTGHLLRRYVDPWIALELIRTWNAARCRPPLTDAEIEQVVSSIAGREIKRRQEAGHGR